MGLFLLLVIGLFAFIQFMPGWKSTAVVSVLYVAGIVYLNYELQDVDGPGGLFTLMFAGLLMISAVAGIATKVLFLATRRLALRYKIAARISGFALVPVLIYSPVLYDLWQRRPPSAACSYDVVTYSVGRRRFEIPSLGIVSVMQGRGKGLKDTRQFNFIGPKSAREFCETFDNGKTPARVDAVSLRLEEIPRARSDDRFSLLCEKGGWPQAVCRYTGSSDLGGYPLKVGIYDKAKFNAGYTGGGWDYDRIKQKIVSATKPSDLPGFAFDGHTYYFIDNETDADASKAPFALSCFKSRDRLYCSSDERWSDGVYVTYGGTVSLANPVEDARALRQKTLDFIGQMEIDPEPGG